MTYGGDDCERCSVEIKPTMEANRQGGCAKCVYASNKYNEFPCGECVEEETTETKFPRFKLATIWKNAFRG